MQLLIDFHKDAERQGPGSHEDTLRALSFTELDNRKHLKVLDIGCGSGAQTLSLAQNLNAEITAVDLFPEFLNKLNIRAQKLGVQERIITLQKSMDDLSFENGEFDLIWSEGAIYIIGFQEGIRRWKDYLKVGGYIAVSEITWTTNSRPAEIEEHWKKEYPQVDTASNKMKVLEENGFSPVGYFYLPESSWINNYYKPIEDRFDKFLTRHKNNELAQGIVETEKDEIRKYRAYKDNLSYGFYIARKVN